MQPSRRPLIRPLGALALSLIALVGGPAPGWAQAEPGSDALMASLLGAEDLPAGFQSAGPIEGSDFDIDSAAFDAHGGERVVSQVWQDEQAQTVFDFRMEFPSAQAAAEYLEAAEPTLSEAEIMGLAPVMFEEPVGEDGRHYFGVIEIDETQSIVFDNYLFHVGPVAAKVYVASLDMAPEETRGLAERAAERMAEIAAGGATTVSETPAPAGSPPAADESAPVVVESPPAEGTVPPADDPAADDPAADDPAADDPAADDPAATLLALVPESVRTSCEVFSSGTPGEVAALSCFVEDTQVVYATMADAASLRSAFDFITSEVPSSGQSASCAEGEYVGTYPGGGATPQGLVACWQPPGADLVAFWTDDANLVLGGMLTTTTEHAELAALWQASLLESRSD